MDAKLVGNFQWNSEERRSDRFGYFMLDPGPLTHPELLPLEGKKVRIVAKVLEVHPEAANLLGDLILGVEPSTPEMEECIDLGVGILGVIDAPWNGAPVQIGLIPEDDRDCFWFDPEKWFRLRGHDVEITIEPTTDPCTVPSRKWVPSRPIMVATGDGGFQWKGDEPDREFSVHGKVTRLAEHTFQVSYDFARGEIVRWFYTAP